MRGPINQALGASDDGMVMDPQELSAIFQRSVLQPLDQQFLNEVIGVQSTAEISASLPYRVRLWETATGYVEITRAERNETRDEVGELAATEGTPYSHL